MLAFLIDKHWICGNFLMYCFQSLFYTECYNDLNVLVLRPYSKKVKLKPKKKSLYVYVVLVNIYTGSFSFKGRNGVGFMLGRSWDVIRRISESGEFISRLFNWAIYLIFVLGSIVKLLWMETVYLCWNFEVFRRTDVHWMIWWQSHILLLLIPRLKHTWNPLPTM